MEKLKFRVWDKLRNEMIYGPVWINDDGNPVYFVQEHHGLLQMDDGFNDYSEMHQSGDYEGQFGDWIKEYRIPLRYINLKDDKKKKIYVRDKVKWLGHEVKEGKQIRPERIFIVTDDIYDLYRIKNIVLSGTASPEVICNIYEDSG